MCNNPGNFCGVGLHMSNCLSWTSLHVPAAVLIPKMTIKPRQQSERRKFQPTVYGRSYCSSAAARHCNSLIVHTPLYPHRGNLALNSTKRVLQRRCLKGVTNKHDIAIIRKFSMIIAKWNTTKILQCFIMTLNCHWWGKCDRCWLPPWSKVHGWIIRSIIINLRTDERKSIQAHMNQNTRNNLMTRGN